MSYFFFMAVTQGFSIGVLVYLGARNAYLGTAAFLVILNAYMAVAYLANL